MFKKLWRQLRRQGRGMRMDGPAGIGRTLAAQTGVGERLIGIPILRLLPNLWQLMVERAARRGFKPIVFIDGAGLDEIPLPPREDDALQK